MKNRFAAMRKRPTSMVLLALCISLVAVESIQAQTISLRSGNGTIGGNDTQVNMLIGPADSAFSSSFTATDFTNARTGADAFVISPHGAWGGGLPSNGAAQWISTSATGASEGSTALYAIDFIVSGPFSSATLDLRYKVDNQLGGGPNQGVFINGLAISGSSVGGGFGGEFSITRNDIAALLTVGTNTLYINSTDTGGPAGLIFSATLTTTPTAVSEPNIIGLLGIGWLGLMLLSRKLGRFANSHN